MAAVASVRPSRLLDDSPDELAVPPFATRGVAVIAALLTIGLLYAASRYCFFGDELYFLAAGRRPGYSYADQGAFVPLLARLADLIAPGSAPALRIPAVLACATSVVLSAAIAREFGGGTRAQLYSAAAYATSPLVVTQGALSTFSFDATWSATISWLLVRWVRTRRDRLLIAAGLVAAVDIQVKWLIPVTWACLGVGVLLLGPRELLRKPALWGACGIFLLGGLPDLYWQSRNGWPEVAMGKVIGAEQDAAGGGPLACLPQIVGLAGVLGAVLLAFGSWGLLRFESLRPYRFLLPAVLALTVVVVAGHGRPYYVSGMFPAFFAAGAVTLGGYNTKRWVRLTRIPVALASAVVVLAAVVALPLPDSLLRRPVGTQAEYALRVDLFGPEGWQDLTTAVAASYRALPTAVRGRAVIVTDSYWQASALEEFGRKYGLPKVYSPSRGFGYFGPPPDSATTVLYVGVDDVAKRLRGRFAVVRRIGEVNRPLGFPGVNRGVAIWLCRRPAKPWSQSWPTMKTLTLDMGI